MFCGSIWRERVLLRRLLRNLTPVPQPRERGTGRPKAPHERLTSVWTLGCDGKQSTGPCQENKDRLWTICVILLVLWLLELVTSYTLGGFVHILLVIAVVVLLIQLFQGRRVV